MPNPETSSNPESEISDEEIYEVERIISKKVIYGEVKYYIKWKNYPNGHNSWEPVDNLSCEELMKAYEAKHARRIGSIEWDPKPKTILQQQTIDGKTEYLVEFEDGERGTVALTFGPMKKLIDNWNKENDKGEEKEKEKANEKSKKKDAKKDNEKETKESVKNKRGGVKRKVDADENGNQKDMECDSTASLIYSYEVDRIIEMRRAPNYDGVEYLVKYKESDKTEWVPINIVKRNHPQKVINFYESCVTWE